MNNNITEVPEGFKMTELGALPKEWETIKLKDILDLLRNGITKTQNKSDKGVPVSRIETISDERINPQKVGYIKDISTGAIEQYKIQDKDILFSHINSESMLGKTAIYNGQPPLLIHGMNLLLLRANEEIC
jgi:type I restriction enzyme S subunit